MQVKNIWLDFYLYDIYIYIYIVGILSICIFKYTCICIMNEIENRQIIFSISTRIFLL